MSQVSVLGIDIAKQLFHGVGMHDTGTIVWRKRLTRSALMPWIARIPPVVIGMEACGGAHDWARRFREPGHMVKLMAPQFVKPYLKSNTHERADAAAIGEAATRPTMRCVPVKELAQQDFQNGRQVAAWLGLVPRQHSTGGKPHLLGISKRGDRYLRKLLVHGARATLRWIKLKNDRSSQWGRALIARRGANQAAVALANKNARIAWVLLTTDQVYTPKYSGV
jgi:transposase